MKAAAASGSHPSMPEIIVAPALTPSAPRGIVVEPAFIFWANEGNALVGGQIVKLAR